MAARDDHDAFDRAAEAAIASTRRWVEVAVIGLNLCPFARPVASRIRYVVSRASKAKALRADLRRELEALATTDPAKVETTLLVHPWVLQDFHAFNDFLAEADALLEDLDLLGTLQIASFHPHYQFADSAPDDIANATNRAPHPTLHLIREASIERAVRSMPDPALIYERNIATLRALGDAGWEQLRTRFEDGASADDEARSPTGTRDTGA